jgi:ribulose-5-phosphate 4-epimerase/fuculose-1-phosphate aldolase
LTQTDNSRLELKRAVVAAVAELYEHELITPTGGNLSLRCPDSDHVLITASQIFKGNLGPEHILEVDGKGKNVEADFQEAPSSGRRIRPSVETGMHLAIYATRPDVGAVVHTHAPLATVWGLFDEPVAAFTIDCIRFAEMRVVPFAAPGGRELATLVSEALIRGSATLLRNHGLVTVGKDLREAVNMALALEESLRVVLLARIARLCGLTGEEPAVIPPKAVDFLKKVVIG